MSLRYILLLMCSKYVGLVLCIFKNISGFLYTTNVFTWTISRNPFMGAALMRLNLNIYIYISIYKYIYIHIYIYLNALAIY